MQQLNLQDGDYLYRQVIDQINVRIRQGALRPGDRLPSLRKMSRAAGVSIPTVRQAYVELERQRRIEARPQSGFYVRHIAGNDLVHITRSRMDAPIPLNCRSLMERVYNGINDPALVPLGIANPTMARPAIKGLHRAMKRVMARAEERILNYSATLGEPLLRRQVAYHYLDATGAQVDPEHIGITNGGQEALLLALRSVAGEGDIIAVETPTYHGMLELIDSLGMLAIEIETCPETGVSLDELERALGSHDIRACIFTTTLSNPLGVTMPESNRRRLLELLEPYDAVLIEDDVYGDLRYDGERPVPAQFLGGGAKVITCGSFSKTAAPGYRIGWIVSGRYIERIARLKRSFSCTSALLQQLTLADFVASGDFARHLQALRPVLKRNAERMAALVARHFPAETRTSQPAGGAVLWVELPAAVDAEKLFDDAIRQGISIAPGHIFSPCSCYTNFARLGFGHPWDERTESAVRWLGERVMQLAQSGARPH